MRFLTLIGAAALAGLTLAGTPASAQPMDGGMSRHMEHRMMRHEERRMMRHRMMRHEERRMMRRRMIRHRMMRDGM